MEKEKCNLLRQRGQKVASNYPGVMFWLSTDWRIYGRVVGKQENQLLQNLTANWHSLLLEESPKVLTLPPTLQCQNGKETKVGTPCDWRVVASQFAFQLGIL